MAEVASLLPPRQAEALEQPGLTPQQRIWHVVHTFKQRCQLLDRWGGPGPYARIDAALGSRTAQAFTARVHRLLRAAGARSIPPHYVPAVRPARPLLAFMSPHTCATCSKAADRSLGYCSYNIGGILRIYNTPMREWGELRCQRLGLSKRRCSCVLHLRAAPAHVHHKRAAQHPCAMRSALVCWRAGPSCACSHGRCSQAASAAALSVCLPAYLPAPLPTTAPFLSLPAAAFAYIAHLRLFLFLWMACLPWYFVSQFAFKTFAWCGVIG